MIALTQAAASSIDSEVDEQRAQRRRIGREPHCDLRRDAERSLAADEHAAQVVAGGLGLEAAERRQRPVGQHDLDGEDVRRRDAVGEAVRPARVVGDVAADRARLLARRIGREVQPERRERAREIEVDDTGLDPRHPFVGVDRHDPVHLRRHDHDGTAERNRAAGEAGARTTRGERPAVPCAPDARTPAPRRSSAGSRPRPRRRRRTIDASWP